MKSLTTLLAEMEREFDIKWRKSILILIPKIQRTRDIDYGLDINNIQREIKTFLRSQIKKVLKEVGEELSKELKKSFEANLLDGDKVEDCGKASLDAKYVWDWLDEDLRKKLKEMLG